MYLHTELLLIQTQEHNPEEETSIEFVYIHQATQLRS